MSTYSPRIYRMIDEFKWTSSHIQSMETFWTYSKPPNFMKNCRAIERKAICIVKTPWFTPLNVYTVAIRGDGDPHNYMITLKDEHGNDRNHWMRKDYFDEHFRLMEP